MKKIITFSFVLVASAAIFAACNKTRTCTCTETYTDTSTTPATTSTSTTTVSIASASKATQKAQCASYTRTSGTETDVVSCTLN